MPAKLSDEQKLLRTVTEAQFQSRVVQAAKLCGWRVAHFRPAITRSGKWATHMEGDPGFPDLVLARRGAVIFAEVKRETGKVGPEQAAWLDALGGVAPNIYRRENYVWRPSDWDKILEVLK